MGYPIPTIGATCHSRAHRIDKAVLSVEGIAFTHDFRIYIAGSVFVCICAHAFFDDDHRNAGNNIKDNKYTTTFVMTRERERERERRFRNWKLQKEIKKILKSI